MFRVEGLQAFEKLSSHDPGETHAGVGSFGDFGLTNLTPEWP